MKHIFLLALLLTASPALRADDAELSPQFIGRVPVERAHSFTGAAAETAFRPDAIKVLVWNIKKTEEKEWQSEFLRFTKNRELLVLQEVHETDRFLFGRSSHPRHRFDLGTGFRYRGLNTGVMNAATVRPTENKVLHSEDVEPVVLTPKATIFTKYPIQGKAEELLVISVHGINLTNFASFKRHMDQAIAEIKAHTGPVLWAGDFNTRTKERTAYLMEKVRELNFSEVVFKNGDQRMVWKFTKNYLDHAFVRGLSVKYAEVLAQAKGSDHKPMVLDLALEEEL